MRNYIYILAIITFILIPNSVWSERVQFNIDELIPESLPTREPFVSQLPDKPKPKPKQPVAIRAKPPKTFNTNTRRETLTPAPVQPPKAIQMPQLVISGIIWNTDKPQAIVNGQVVEEGDTVSKAKIIAINKDGIEVSFSGKKAMIK